MHLALRMQLHLCETSWSGFPNHREAWWVWDARGSNRAGSLLYLVVHTVLYSQCIFNVCVYTQRHFIHLAGCTCAAFLQCARSDKAGSGRAVCRSLPRRSHPTLSWLPPVHRRPHCPGVLFRIIRSILEIYLTNCDN